MVYSTYYQGLVSCLVRLFQSLISLFASKPLHRRVDEIIWLCVGEDGLASCWLMHEMAGSDSYLSVALSDWAIDGLFYYIFIGELSIATVLPLTNGLTEDRCIVSNC